MNTFYDLALLMRLPEKTCANGHFPANASLAHLDFDDMKIDPSIDFGDGSRERVRTGVFEISVICPTTNFANTKLGFSRADIC